ncbi:helix-turn-helix transcriptional regulator [Kribbella sp. VKM Ac-2571]|uniref:helix-turn-helix domain-containing protein n=1 Tax=Kribbella sp. VKM Ac-2571 TaxID=2512222 RepID=UPI001415051F|nr:helix-turn-helix transcriptional regulator [Kribbella sp. VKM Ac-2571]
MEDVAAFAAALDRVRRQAGLSYRQLADRAHYSHPHLIRATSGKHLPTWEVAAAYLTGCGVPTDLLPVWHRRWQQASRDPRDIVGLLENVQDLEDLGVALAALARPRSLRALEQQTGIPRATIQAWLQGTRLPGRDRLDHLVRSVGATPAERSAVANAIDRLATARDRTGRAPVTSAPVNSARVGRAPVNSARVGRAPGSSARVRSGRLRPAPAA